MSGTRSTHSAYFEMLELLGGSAEDGFPPTEFERFEVALGTRRDPVTFAPVRYSKEEKESMIRRIVAEYLAHRPEVAAVVRKQACARLKVRFPRALYREVVAAAQADGTSANTFVLTACAIYLGRRRVVTTAPEQTLPPDPFRAGLGDAPWDE